MPNDLRALIAARYPNYSEIEICHELARRTGNALADAVYSGLVPGG